jgi:hypothetical protein
VLGKAQQAYPAVTAGEPSDHVGTGISGAIVDEDDLGRLIEPSKRLHQLLPQDRQALGLVVHGEDDREIGLHGVRLTAS